MVRLLHPILCCLAIVNANAQAMTRIFSADTPAHKAILKFMRGVNLGNSLEYGTGNPAGGLTYSTTDFTQIRSEGFDHVRIPVAWHLYLGGAPSFAISSSIFTRVDAVVKGALAKNLSVIINLHQYTAFMSDPNGNTPQFYAIWRQVAEHYATFSSAVAFELLNEPNGVATTSLMNRIYPEAIRQIRLTNPDRTIFVGPGNYNSMDELKIGGGFVLPNGEANLITSVHCYDPYYFTHQGAEWALPDTGTTGVLFPGPPPEPIKPAQGITHSYVFDWFRGYNTKSTSVNPSSSYAFRDRLRLLKSWSDYYGRPVHVGEFGCYQKADPVSRVNFHREIRSLMDSNGLGWAMWDWKAGFHYMKNGRPDPPDIREAIFPPVQLEIKEGRFIEIASAVGKTFVVQSADSLAPPVVWRDLSTVVLTTPKFSFPIPDTSNAAVFYRFEWIK